MAASSDSKAELPDGELATPTQRSDSERNPSTAPTVRRKLTIGVLLCAIALLTAWNLYHGRRIWRDERNANAQSSSDFAQVASGAQFRNQQFDTTTSTVPRSEILSGGPPKDGIPALTSPQFIAAGDASYLKEDDRVIGFVRGREARGYPLKILNYHEIVNDQLDDLPVAITYCPLCDSVAAFDRRTPLGKREFGVSGLLYNSNVLMYDRGGRPESLWSQVKAEGISGPAAAKPLKALPVELTTWGDWRTRHPQTIVLSQDTGHSRDYQRDPYAGYFDQPGLMFPANPTSDRLPAKQRVLGVWTDAAARAYPASAFSAERRRIADRVDGKKVVIEFNPRARSLRIVEADDGVRWMYSLWFAWHAFRPETEVFE